ncbi:MAG: lamin tail domain-containing protein, partial [Sedimentisphaerales bacterium]|nr:lamin tail domain-containing protein [Sedimentisphaerales bacterium]
MLCFWSFGADGCLGQSADGGIGGADPTAQASPVVVINELHVDPDVKTERVEFVELHNPEAEPVDLSGWQLTEGVFYTFPEGAVLPANGYVIVAEDPSQIHAKWSSGRFGIRASLVFGPYVGKLDNEADHVVLCDAVGQLVDEVDYQVGFPWPTVGDAVPESAPGNGYSMQLTNPLFDNNLGGCWRSALPTPAAANRSAPVANIAPQVRQVKHSPREPRSGDVVTISAKVTDPDGVKSISFLYQVVNPGNYIARQDAQYGTSWVIVAMHDDGLNGDAVAGDDVFSVQLPGSLQTHRRLVRYRMLVTDNLDMNAFIPYSDDPQPNFAYFVYDGVPAWRGAVQPGVTPVIEFPVEVMRSLPVYHLISKKSDVEDSTWFSRDGSNEFRWWGTLVYDGEVYDHIRYRMRGGVWRYSMAKNMFKLDFNRSHYFQARDDYGNEYATKWNRLNFSACIQQGSFGQRGEQGMFEALTCRLFNLAGCPASKTNYFQFRIIDETYEDGERNAAHRPLTSTGTQYDGDFWGLYMTIEQMDGRFLDEHGLPDGNLYKMDDAYPGGYDKNNQGPTQVDNNTDVEMFRGMYQSRLGAAWWAQNVNLDAYYAYYAIYQAVHHGDITSKNWYLYHHPVTDQWWQLPWDVDLTWTTYYGSNDPSDPFSRAGIFSYAELDVETKNHLREVVDLLFNAEQTGQLIDDYAAIINDPAGGLSMVDADRAMWDYHWVMSDAACSGYRTNCGSDKAGQGRFYQEAVDRHYDRSFEGMVQVMKDYVDERVPYLNTKSADTAIPNTPLATSVGPEDFPANALVFRSSAFSDPQGAGTFAAMKWRIAEVAAGSQVPKGADTNPVLLPDGAMWKYFKGLSEPSTTRGAWRQVGFDDSQWAVGNAPVGYGESFIATVLSDMPGNYSTLYLRTTFDVSSLNSLSKLILEVRYDDGVNVWINGMLAYQENVSSTEVPYDGLAPTVREDSTFYRQELGDPRAWLRQGTNVVAVQVLNILLSGSSDCFADVRLTAERMQGGAEEPVTPAAERRPGKYEIEP